MRSSWTTALVFGSMILGSAAVGRAADEKSPVDPPKAANASASEKPAKKMKAVRLVKPWSGMTSLSDDQRAKIAELHKKSLQEKKEVERREHDAIMTLLDDKQKEEVASLTEKDAVAKKSAKSAGADKSDASKEKAAEKTTEKAG